MVAKSLQDFVNKLSQAQSICMMSGRDEALAGIFDPVFASPELTFDAAPGTSDRDQRAGISGHGYLHYRPGGAGRFAKRIHDDIDDGMWAAYLDGLNISCHADVGNRPRAVNAETSPLRHTQRDIGDLKPVENAEEWRRDSVVYWLLDLTVKEVLDHTNLEKFTSRASDRARSSGQSRRRSMSQPPSLVRQRSNPSVRVARPTSSTC